VNFSVSNVNLTWTDKDLKEKQKQKGKGDKQLRKRGNHFSKRNKHGNDKERENCLREKGVSLHHHLFLLP